MILVVGELLVTVVVVSVIESPVVTSYDVAVLLMEVDMVVSEVRVGVVG